MREKRSIDELEALFKAESEPELVLSQDGLRPAPTKKSVRKVEPTPKPVQLAEEVWD